MVVGTTRFTLAVSAKVSVLVLVAVGSAIESAMVVVASTVAVADGCRRSRRISSSSEHNSISEP